MSYSNTILGQLLNFLPKDKFYQCVGQHKSDKHVKSFTSWNQLVVLLYAQATNKDSLREIETGFNLHASALYHLGINSVARSSLSYVNGKRDYRLFEKLFYALLEQCRDITPNRNFSFENPLYLIDSSLIKLCLSVFDWAEYSKVKGALKLHVLLNNRSTIPEIITVSTGKMGDITAARQMNSAIEKGSIVVFDRAYIDYRWWRDLAERGCWFVSRTKRDQNIFYIGQHKKELELNILADEEVILGAYDASKKHPNKLRRIKYYDEKKQKEYTYLTNNFTLSASQIAQIYKERWQIEIFFKWIKQHLKIKTFLGTSKNAVLTQIWVAMIYYLLLSYIKFQTKFKKSLLELTRMIRETILFKRNLIDLLSLTVKTLYKIESREKNLQLTLL